MHPDQIHAGKATSRRGLVTKRNDPYVAGPGPSSNFTHGLCMPLRVVCNPLILLASPRGLVTIPTIVTRTLATVAYRFLPFR